MFRSMNLLLILLYLSGCASTQRVHLYDGPALSPDHSIQISLPLELEIAELDGRLVPSSQQRFRADDLTLILTPGQHKLVMHYESIWDIDNDNHETVRSQPVLFEFTAQAGEHFRFEYETPLSLKQAKAFAQTAAIQLVSTHQTVAGFGLKKADPLTFNVKKAAAKTELPYLQQLQYWWAQATTYEQKKFKEWINRQDAP